MKGVKHYRKGGTEHKGVTHRMSDGSLHSGKAHTAASKPLFHFGQLSKKDQVAARSSWKK